MFSGPVTDAALNHIIRKNAFAITVITIAEVVRKFTDKLPQFRILRFQRRDSLCLTTMQFFEFVHVRFPFLYQDYKAGTLNLSRAFTKLVYKEVTKMTVNLLDNTIKA